MSTHTDQHQHASTTITAADIIRRYADDIAFVAETKPATTLIDFVPQLQTAAHYLDIYARIHGAEDLDTAVVLLTEALDAEDAGERSALLNRADRYLKYVADIVDEYRLMV